MGWENWLCPAGGGGTGTRGRAGVTCCQHGPAPSMGVLPERSGEGRVGGNRMGTAPRSCPHPLCGVPGAPAWGRSALWCSDSTGDGDTGMGTGRGKGPAAQHLPFSPTHLLLPPQQPQAPSLRKRIYQNYKNNHTYKKKKMPQQGVNIPQPMHPPQPSPCCPTRDRDGGRVGGEEAG